jgi:hypothetical protein
MLPQLTSLGGHPAAAVVSLSAQPSSEELRLVRSSWARNWPFLVILLAVLGMIVALLLLVVPRGDSSVRRRSTPLSNDRMDTDKLPSSGRGGDLDPWKSPPRGGAPDPAAGSSGSAPGADPPADPDPADPMSPASPGIADPDDSAAADPDPLGGTPSPDADDVAVPDLVDPFADPADPTADPSDLMGTLRALQPSRGNVLSLMAVHLCERAASCGADPVHQQMCARMLTNLATRPSRCFHPVKARMCLRLIDRLPCDRLPTVVSLQSIPVCEELMTC